MNDKSSDGSKRSPRELCTAIFLLAKKWWTYSFLCKLIVFIIGVIAILNTTIYSYVPLLVFILSGVSEACIWYSNSIKDTAELLLRLLDEEDAFGRQISNAEISDILIRSPAKIRNNLRPQNITDTYYSSVQGVGLKRALENLEEASWWSKHLSEKTGHFYLVITIIILIGSLSMVVFSVLTIQDFEVVSSISRIVTSTVVLIFSLGLVRLTLGYYRFSRKAFIAENEARRLLKLEVFDEIQVARVIREYQIARVRAPLVPNWIWTFLKKDISQTWSEFRQSVR